MTYYNNQKQQFILRDVLFFKKDKGGNLHQLGQKATDKEIMDKEGVTLRLMDQNSGHKKSCIHHEKNVGPYFNPVIALGRQCTHLRKIG